MSSPSERHRRASQLFLEVCELPVRNRSALLDAACRGDDELRREVEGLLARDADPSSFLEGAPLGRPLFEAILDESGAPGGTQVPERIGAYRITGVLGRGGMGVVYRAEQERPRRQVALKVIRSGITSPAVLRRFEHEAQVLARLAHPGIAQVYEAGVVPATGPGSEPVPFFAMELVEGEQLGGFAARAGLPTRDRLELFARVCDAVQYAHTKGVVHRDLKPANILVTPGGEAKILDFGVARATDSDVQTTTLRTDVGQILGTLGYMSPEQLAADPADIDTRSDVYALGATLYELLCGRPAQDVGGRMIHEAARIVREERPARLSSISPRLRGEIETIVGKALEKDRGRRYQSAADLAADIRRYLRHEPIAARPPSAAYRVRKLATRHRGVFIAATLAVLALITGVVGFAWQAHRAATQRDETAAQRDVAKQVTEFFVGRLQSQDPNQQGRQGITVAEAMRTAAADLSGGELDAQPEAKAAILRAIAAILAGNGSADEAEPLARTALELEERLHRGDHPDIAEGLGVLVTVLGWQGRMAEAEPLMVRRLDMERRLYPPDHPAIASSLGDLAVVRDSAGDWKSAMGLYEEALAVTRRVRPVDERMLATALSNLALTMSEHGRSAEAEPLEREALAIFQRLYPGDHPHTATVLGCLAGILQGMGRPEAEGYYKQALDMNRRIFAGDHPVIAESLNNLGNELLDLGRPAEADPFVAEALEMFERMQMADTAWGARCLANLARARQAQGNPAEAEPMFERARAMIAGLYPEGHPANAVALAHLAMCQADLGKLLEAQETASKASAIAEQALEEGHQIRTLCHDRLEEIERRIASNPTPSGSGTR